MIKVDTVCLEAQARQMNSIADQLNKISASVASVNRALRWNTSIDIQVRNSLSSCSKSVFLLDDKASGMGNVLSASAAKYRTAEQNAKKGEFLPKLPDVIGEVADTIIPIPPGHKEPKIPDAVERIKDTWEQVQYNWDDIERPDPDARILDSKVAGGVVDAIRDVVENVGFPEVEIGDVLEKLKKIFNNGGSDNGFHGGGGRSSGGGSSRSF